MLFLALNITCLSLEGKPSLVEFVSFSLFSYLSVGKGRRGFLLTLHGSASVILVKIPVAESRVVGYISPLAH